MDNYRDSKNRRQEGRKRTYQRTDDEDDDESVTASAPLTSADLSSLSNQMEGMVIDEVNNTSENACVGSNDKRIKSEVPEVVGDKMEGIPATTVKNESRNEKENEQVFEKKKTVEKDKVMQADKERSKENMATAPGEAPSSVPSKRIRGRASKSARSSRCQSLQNIRERGSGAGGDYPIAIASSSKAITGNDDGFEPTPKAIPRKPPEVGDSIYAMFENLEYPWLLAEVLEIVRNEHTEQTEYVIRFEPTTKKGEPASVEIPDETFRKMRQVCLKMTAASFPCKFRLPVGSRVIAKLIVKEHTQNLAQFYAGIVADQSKVKERRKHYLIFFDVGISQYVHADHVHLILDSDKHVWNDVHPDCYDFIREYIIKWPNWPMVLLRVGQIVATEWNGLWIPSRIRKVDESLAYAQFENDGQCEWIHRGSGRFRPAPTPLLENEKEKLGSGTWTPKGEESPSAKKMKKAKACSSYNAKEIYKEVLFFSSRGDHGRIMNDFRIELDDPTLCIEYQGRLKKIKIPTTSQKQRVLVEHYCDEDCAVAFEKREEFRKLSPLVIPFFFGWTRHKIMEPTKHEIYYRAPCRYRLNDGKTLKDFLKLTKSDFSIDNFCFDYDVDCENEFVAARELLKMEDISGGREVMAVSLVNSIDGDAPEEFEYLRERELGPGVELSEDKGFLACCECEDGDCSDQDKCPCWQMTKQGVDFNRLNNEIYPTEGYEQRKLRDQLSCAIYECNERCACNKSCTNRVVQNGCQWPLQVFKTRGKGWGVRALFDIPLGTFVGYYTGEIFDNDYAEEFGKTRGDEYFLQLDYIEKCADVKEGYEEDVAVADIKQERNEDADDEDDSMEEGQRRDGGEKKLKERRKLFGRKEDVFVVDSKKKGNVTRFMNHCCNPNLFPQNVFVTTQDLRFPMVALFSDMLIKAGSELTWDYNYSVGDVAGTVVECKCMAYNCKGRLL